MPATGSRKKQPRNSPSSLAVDPLTGTAAPTSKAAAAAAAAAATAAASASSSSAAAFQDRATQALCLRCKGPIGEFYNEWQKITNSYFLPVLLGSFSITGLKTKDSKPASVGSSLDGCQVQPLACQSCDAILGLRCVSAPPEKHFFSNREFFKLPHIALHLVKNHQLVAPILEESRPSHGADETMGPAADVELPTRPNADQDSTMMHAPVQKQTSFNPAAHAVPVAPKPPREQVMSGVDTTNGHPQVNGHSHPDHEALNRDALSRIQVQVSYNTAGLQAQKRDIELLQAQDRARQHSLQRVDGAVGRLQQEMTYVMEVLRQLQEKANAPMHSPPRRTQVEDTALEAMAQQLASVAAKANEVDSLKVEVELLRRKLKRYEEPSQPPSSAASYSYPRVPSMTQTPDQRMPPMAQTTEQPAPPQQLPSQPLPSQQLPSQQIPSQQIPSQQVPSQQVPSQQVSAPHATQYPVRPPTEPRPTSSYRPPSSSEHSRTLEPETQSSGWAAVNSCVKRPPPPAIDESSDPAGVPIGSPKRPKLAPLEPRLYGGPPEAVYDRMETEPKHHPQPETQESYVSETAPSTFITYHNTQDANPDDSWHPESQQYAFGHDPGMSRRGGRGSGRGGRPRKRGTDAELGTPEWERPDWTGSQVGPEGWYTHTTPGKPSRGGIVRRGTSNAATVATAANVPNRSPSDPYAHTKKTRTKPIRNSDGILIRKDGQPDMRSQSSAANLRKVHARKEQERSGSDGGGGPRTPTSGLASAPLLATSASQSPSVDDHGGGDGDGDSPPAEPNTQERHQAIMRQIFPHGVDETRDRINYAERYFPRDSSPTEAKMPPSAQMLPADPRPATGHGADEAAPDVVMGGTAASEADEAPPARKESAGMTESTESPMPTVSDGATRTPEADAE